MLKYDLLGQTVVFEDAAERYYDLLFASNQACLKASQQFKAWYSQRGNIQAVLDGYLPFAESLVEQMAFRPLFSQLAACEIYDMSEETYWKRCIGLGESESALESRLELPLFQVYLNGFTIYLVVSDHKPKYARLPKVLNSHIHKRMEKMKLPYLIGYDALAEPIIVDLAEFPHLLEGGSSGSGKTVGLQILIASIASTKEPSEVNFILIDVGVGDLIPFDKIPHLSCPVIQNHETAHNALIALEAEMKKRIQLKNENPTAFTQMPRLVLVIDEFTDLVTGGGDKDMSMQMADSISSLLRKGRHAKIHLVLATQNPVYRNMKVAMENITARIAFRCAKKNNSETILGAEGAEYLDGEGSLLLKSPQNMGLQRIQGIYINATEIRQLVQELKSRQWRYSMLYFKVTRMGTPLMSHRR